MLKETSVFSGSLQYCFCSVQSYMPLGLDQRSSV